MPYRSRKHTYLKKQIDGVFRNLIFDYCRVSLRRLTEEDIEHYKLSVIKNNDNTPKGDGNISKDDNTSKVDNTFEDDKTSKGDKRPKDDNNSEDGKTSKDDKTSKDNTSIDNEPAKKKQKVDTNGIDVMKLVLSRKGETHKFKSQFKSSLKSNKEIASTSTEEEPIVIDCEEPTESANSLAKNIKPKICIKDPKVMMDADKYLRWLKMMNNDQKSKHLTNSMNNLAVATPSTSGTQVNEMNKHVLNSKKFVKGHLLKIENLYKKYFSKSVQDTIVVIANILNIISMSNKHHKARMDESFKKRSEAEKLKERCDANRLHGRHKKILETKLKTHFVNIVSTFEASEFEYAFQIFFLGILTVLRVLDQPKFKRGSIFKNLVLLLWNSLKNSDYNHPKVFSLFRLKTFRPDCIDLISLIEDSRDVDPGVVDRMSLFFVSTVNSRECFQAVIDAVTGDSNEDLALLIDNATFLCSIHSKFKDPVDPPTPPTAQLLNDNIPSAQTILNPVNNDEVIRHWFLSRNPDGTYHQVPIFNANKPQTISHTAVKPTIVTSQPLNNFYQSFSSSLQNNTNEPSTSKVIPTNKCFVVASTQQLSHSSLVKVTASLSETVTSMPTTATTFVTFKPPIQNKIPVANNFKPEGSTIIVGNKTYQLVKGSAGQMKAVFRSPNIIVRPPVKPTVVTKCYAKNCDKPATIMCSSCKSVKYCSHCCQRLDWYDNHINECDQLLNKK